MPIRCIECHRTEIQEVVNENRRYYYCMNCQKLYERAIDPRYGRDVVINTKEGIKHLSAGLLIKNEGKFLLIKRRNFPFTYAFPAGHIEYNENKTSLMY